MRASLVFVSVALAGTAFAPNRAAAQLIAADSFNAADYADPFFPGDAQLRLSGPNADGNPVVTPGWVDNGSGSPSGWSVGTANLNWDTDATNPTLRSVHVAYDDDSTGKVSLAPIAAGGFGVTFRAGERGLDPYTPSDTYYMSALLNPGGAFGAGARGEAMVGFTNGSWTADGFNNVNTSAGNPFGLMFGFHGEQSASNPAATDQVDLVVRARQGDVNDPILVDNVLLSGTSESPLDSTTYLLMLRVDVNVDGGAFDKVTYWVDPANVATEQSATNSAVATGSFDTLAFNTTADITRLRTVFNQWETRSFFFDEVRLAGDFESLRGEVPLSGIDGDYNNDGVVNAADYTVWRDNNGAPLTLPNDITPGTVDSGDYTVWANNYGADAPAGAAAAIPEPTATLLLLVGMVGGCVSCRR
ncbi:hypothetical protein Pla108_39200 [Botrimarina colliarenosi]|uniref:PEP-CTERM protein-sorting domain-containing protein n=1 Tax=Botrimarina colliarenosi TaxID=2528001 RepID=A0A5C6A1Y5_9BACT|nr:PEP-CTERM sorting domain-containing protein [Botrimarina colliarenosi]TWT93426.1 hypothetical protein Pla108_39200 [Botrimarina colliarenosi]